MSPTVNQPTAVIINAYTKQFRYAMDEAANKLKSLPQKPPRGKLAAAAAVILLDLGRPRFVSPELAREQCATCGKRIPPGRAGRDCADCRKATP